MKERDDGKKNPGRKNVVPGGRSAMNLLEALRPEIRDELDRDGIVELVSVSVNAVPDPDRPDDRLAMKVNAEVNDNFRAGIPAIDRDLDWVDTFCSTSEDDLTVSLRDELLVTLETRRREFAELKEGKVDGKPAPFLSDPAVAALIKPTLENPVIEDLVWALGWSVIKEDDGRLLVYCENPQFSEYVDEESWARIQDRMRRVNYIIGGMMGRLMGEG